MITILSFFCLVSLLSLEFPQGIILSSFFWGYMLMQIVGGQLSDKHGGELILWVFGFGWSVAILSIAATASVSSLLVIIANFINGLCQG